MNPADAFTKIRKIYEVRQLSKKRGSQGPMLHQAPDAEEFRRKAKSVERNAIYHQFSGMTEEENQAFDELFKITRKQISDVNKRYKQ